MTILTTASTGSGHISVSGPGIRPITRCLAILILLSGLLPFHIAAQQPPARSQAAAGQAGLPSQPDWEGLKRDTWYFMGAQVASLGVLYALPEAVTNWSEEQKDNFSLTKWRENVSNPQIDEDEFYLNYILHPYWGATYYVRARERGYGKLGSFWYSAFLSTFYELGPEALFEQPSIQDLIVTPVFGAWLGEYFVGLRSAVRERSAARGYRTRGENWTWYLTDPLNLISTGVERLLGRQASLSFRPLLGVSPGAVSFRMQQSGWRLRHVNLPPLPESSGVFGFDDTFPGRGTTTGMASRSLQGRINSLSDERISGFTIRLSW